MRDCFGNEIDPEVGYARGKILKSSYYEKLKYQHAMNLIGKKCREDGEDKLYIFTGNVRRNQIKPEDIGIMSEEWVGPSLFYEELRKIAIAHFDGNQDDEVAVFNRTSAAIISTILALAEGGNTIISLAPQGKPHPSVVRGTKLAGCNMINISSVEELKKTGIKGRGACIITSVTSELLFFCEQDLREGIKTAKEMNLTVVVDDAYGARIRPILLHQKSALRLGADAAITNNDKAALHGPRAGIMVGKTELILKISAKASELGLEARAPIALGVLRSLQEFNEQDLIEEASVGRNLYNELIKYVDKKYVNQSLLGPELPAEAVLKIAIEKSGIVEGRPVLVPVEASSALGIELIKHYGIITTNACGMPGARPSVRLKSNRSIVNRFGDEKDVIIAVMDCFERVGKYVNDIKTARLSILGQ